MIYAYECEQCGKEVESVFNMGEAAASVKCDSCGGIAKRIFSNAGFLLKGPGDHWPTQQLRRKREMTKRNEDAGKRGYGKWKERSPKLVQQ